MGEIVFDDWQQEILDYRGDIALCKGRRIGGTEIFSIKAAERMVSDAGTKIVFLSLTEDQAKICISVALDHLHRKYRKLIAKGNNKPTQGRIMLTNGSSFMVRPVGNTGNAVRGFDGDVLGIDEAPWQPKMMWTAARPIISTNNGEIWMWGTPAAKEGYFWEQYNKAYNIKDPNARFKVWHKNSEEVLFNRPISESWTEKQREGAIRILGEEKKDMSEIEYGNEYLGLFLDEMNRFFTDEWIKKVCVLKRPKTTNIYGRKSIGADIARLGADEGTIEVINDDGSNILKHVENIVTKKQLTTETEKRLLQAMDFWNGVKLGIDAGSGTLGVSVYDHLLQTRIRNKVVAMNNREIKLDSDGKKKQRMFKNDMYYLLLALGEQGRILLLDDDSVKRSLESVQYAFTKEEDSTTKQRIFGNYTHIVEGIIRAVWLAEKEKSLNLWCR